MFDGMSADAVARLREPSYIGGRAGFWGLDSAAPLVAGTYDAARAAVDVRPHHDGPRARRCARRLWAMPSTPVITRLDRCTAATASSNNAAIVAHAIAETLGSAPRSSMSTITTAMGHGRSSGGAQRRSVRWPIRRSQRAYPYFLGYADETGEGDGDENLNIPLRAGATDRDYLGKPDRKRSKRSTVYPFRSSSSRGFDDVRARPHRRLRPDDAHLPRGRPARWRSSGASILQAGSYHRPSLGENARAWLRGREAAVRPRSRLPASRSEGRSPDPSTRSGTAPTRRPRARRARRRACRHRRAAWSAALVGRPPGFSTLVHIILEQQVSLASARAAYGRLLAATDP